MDITPYVEGLRRDLLAAAEAAGPEVRQAAERLTYALEPSARLALMEAVSQAATEITAEMPSGGVDVRLEGRQLAFVVEAAPVESVPPPSMTPAGAEETEEGGVARVTLRIPESVKARAEELATASGHSLNTWLVNVVRTATRDRALTIDVDLSSIPFLGDGFPAERRPRSATRRLNGWL